MWARRRCSPWKGFLHFFTEKHSNAGTKVAALTLNLHGNCFLRFPPFLGFLTFLHSAKNSSSNPMGGLWRFSGKRHRAVTLRHNSKWLNISSLSSLFIHLFFSLGKFHLSHSWGLDKYSTFLPAKNVLCDSALWKE